MKPAPGVQDPGIEDHAVAGIGRHPLGVRADEVDTTQTREHDCQGAGPARRLPVGAPIAAFHKPKLEPAVVEALEIDACPHDPVRFVGFVPIRSLAGLAIHAVAVPREGREAQMEVVVRQVAHLGPKNLAHRSEQTLIEDDRPEIRVAVDAIRLRPSRLPAREVLQPAEVEGDVGRGQEAASDSESSIRKLFSEASIHPRCFP